MPDPVVSLKFEILRSSAAAAHNGRHEESRLLESRDHRSGGGVGFHQTQVKDSRVPFTVSSGGGGDISAAGEVPLHDLYRVTHVVVEMHLLTL